MSYCGIYSPLYRRLVPVLPTSLGKYSLRIFYDCSQPNLLQDIYLFNILVLFDCQRAFLLHVYMWTD